MTGLTVHARDRRRQRAIPEVVIDLLFKYGQTCDTRGGDIYHFTNNIIKRLRRAGAPRIARTVEEYRRCYLVCCNGRIVTVGHRYKPMRTKETCLQMHRESRQRWRRP